MRIEDRLDVYVDTDPVIIVKKSDFDALNAELQSIRSQSLSTQQPMGEVTDEMVERSARAIAGTAYEGIYFTARTRQQYIDAEWRNHSTDARTALTAALHPNQESGE